MSTYLLELGACYAAMTKKVRATFIVLALLPGLLLLPMAWYMKSSIETIPAQIQLVKAAATGEKVAEEALNVLVKNAKSDTTAKNVFLYSVVAVFVITNLLFSMFLFPGDRMLRAKKSLR